ncbi:MAG: hypothetical protein ABJA81_09290 [Nocardioidaceae bacterium]
MPKSRGRSSKQSSQAKATQAAQRASSKRKRISPTQYRVRRITGWSLVVVGATIGITHFIGHVGFFGLQPSVAMDLAAGYPMAATLGVAGAIVLSKT